ncbi:hypothetical protein DFP72DRAFT_1079877 [Ephemerocybe angulata]|uniref:Uncharacterized protein n=1 Tax=Ephemerocybe angulata TaxID=980116 RepID=A0A8H6LUW7_9AGAR|nr:hypothetical protein DFP72DRAFT_1079877 [Tulosesus angulatus]
MRLAFVPALTALALGVACTFTTAYADATHDNWDARSIIDPSSNTLDARYGSGIEVPFQPVLRDFLEEAVDAYRRHLRESEDLEARMGAVWYLFKYGDKEQKVECMRGELVGDVKKRLGPLGIPAKTLANGGFLIKPKKWEKKPDRYLDNGKSFDEQGGHVKQDKPNLVYTRRVWKE